MERIRVGILGASGYTGAELLRLLLPREDVELKALSAEKHAGFPLEAVWPQLAGQGLPNLHKIAEIDFSALDFVFCALPHAKTQDIVKSLPRGLKIVDLSADFRLKNPAIYHKWYGKVHSAQELQKEAIYGLTELARAEIAKARLVANPGCYPTPAQLALIPLLKADQIFAEEITIDAKSGISGAGRDAKIGNLFSEMQESFQAYGIAAHRHTPEIEQGLSAAAGKDLTVSFTPHLVPIARGIFETIYVRHMKGADATLLRDTLAEAYRNEPFVKVLPLGKLPNVKNVRGTNLCHISVFEDRIKGRSILLAAIDNLVKGAAGQAIQNMNVMLGLPETTGLQTLPLYP